MMRSRQPRYDQVYFDGLVWLDEIAFDGSAPAADDGLVKSTPSTSSRDDLKYVSHCADGLRWVPCNTGNDE